MPCNCKHVSWRPCQLCNSRDIIAQSNPAQLDSPQSDLEHLYICACPVAIQQVQDNLQTRFAVFYAFEEPKRIFSVVVVCVSMYMMYCNLVLSSSGVQAQLARESPTRIDDPENPQGPPKRPATKRQHLVVMRHGERIDEVSSRHASYMNMPVTCFTCHFAAAPKGIVKIVIVCKRTCEVSAGRYTTKEVYSRYHASAWYHSDMASTDH